MAKRNTPHHHPALYRPSMAENTKAHDLPYYPFPMQFQPYPFNMQYPYHHPQLYNYFSQATAPQVSSYPLPPLPPPKKRETSVTHDGTHKIKVIDLEQIDGRVKLEHFDQDREYTKVV